MKSFLLAIVGFAFSAASWAQTDISTAQAHQMSQAGEMVLIDIRTPQEWEQTGVPEGALTINMYDPNFIQDLVAALDGDLEQPIGFICAAGGRSHNLSEYLADQGLPNIFDVQGGMNGATGHTGWADANFPIVAAPSPQ